MKAALALITIGTAALLLWCAPALALDPSLEISQYSHTSWTRRDGFSVGAIFAMAQTPDGYLWLGSEHGLFRFDGVRSVPWQPPAGQHSHYHAAYSLLVTHDGTLWIGTFAGLLSWNGSMDTAVLSSHGLEGHYGLRGMRERATLIKGKLAVWSEVDEGTEVELRVPASAAYTTDRKLSWLLRKSAPKR
jgi:ligand-binding sensor domain-containing protein